MERLKGKTALVFGADGITSGIATRYIQEGASVAVIDTAEALTGFEPGANRFAIASMESSTVAGAVKEAIGSGTLDIMVIGGGDVPPEDKWKPIDEVDPGTIAGVADHDIATVLAAVQAAGPALKAKGGAIIFLFGPAGLYAETGWGDDTIFHHARRGLARSLANEWGQWQVRVNTMVALARTPAYEQFHARNPAEADFRASKSAMQRIGDPVKDIGGAAVFLASEDTRYLTGSMIFADGGNFLGLPAIETTIEKVT